MMAKYPAERYQSVHEVNTNLARLVSETGEAASILVLTKRWRRAAACFVLLVLIAVGLWLLYPFFFPAPSLAVLRFETQGDHPHLAVLAEGIPDTLISELSPLLKVKARSSSFKFSPSSDVQKVGEELDVSAVVKGTLTAAGDFFSISVELVDTRDNQHLGGRQFTNWNLDEVITNQEVLAKEIVKALRLQLTEDESAQFAKRYTKNPEAFIAYQEGRRVYKTLDNQHDAIGYFQEAIAADPECAQAHAGLSYIYGQLTMWGFLPVAEALPMIRKPAARALELDPSLAEAYCAIGQQKVLEWDWRGAEEAFRKAIELNPNLPDGYQYYAIYYLIPMGKLDDAEVQLRTALQLDPLSPMLNMNLGMVHHAARSHDSAIDHYRQALHIDPDYWLAHRLLGYTYCAKEMFLEARSEFALGEPKDCPTCLPALQVPHVLVLLGDMEEAHAALRGDFYLEGKRESEEARMFAITGRIDEALQKLEEVLDNPDRCHWGYDLTLIKVDPKWDPLRDDPRFEDLLRRMNLPLD
jgi:TolB-like protein/Tfp pilus assembly protein PilF